LRYYKTPASSYGVPVLLVVGEPVDAWTLLDCDYRVEEATDEEMFLFRKVEGILETMRRR